MDESTITATESAPLVAQQPAPKKKATLQRLMQRSTSESLHGEPTLRRRRMRVTIEPGVCTPGAFDEEFSLVLEAPSTDVELQAMKIHGATSPAYIVHEMCKLSIKSVDGEFITNDLEREALWEALGFQGRTLLVDQFQELTGKAEAFASARKKASETATLIA